MSGFRYPRPTSPMYPSLYNNYDSDFLVLMQAYGLGGACVVHDAEVRASLQRAGLMVPCDAIVHHKKHRHTMALTKTGRKRAEALVIQRQRVNWRGNAPVKYYKKMRNRVINKNDKITVTEDTKAWQLRQIYRR